MHVNNTRRPLLPMLSICIYMLEWVVSKRITLGCTPATCLPASSTFTSEPNECMDRNLCEREESERIIYCESGCHAGFPTEWVSFRHTHYNQ